MSNKLSTYIGSVKCKNCGHIFNKKLGVKSCPKCNRDILIKELDGIELERD